MMLYNLSGSVVGGERWYRSNKMLIQLKNAMEYNKPRTPLSDIFPLPSSATILCHDIDYNIHDSLPPSDIDHCRYRFDSLCCINIIDCGFIAKCDFSTNNKVL